MIEIKRKENNIVFLKQGNVLKKHNSQQYIIDPLPPTIRNTTKYNDYSFDNWKQKNINDINSIKSSFFSLLNNLSSDYIYRIDFVSLEKDLEKLIYRKSSNKSKH